MGYKKEYFLYALVNVGDSEGPVCCLCLHNGLVSARFVHVVKVVHLCIERHHVMMSAL